MTIREKIDDAANEFICMLMDCGYSTFQIADWFGSNCADLRRPFQNEADNEAAKR